MFFLPCEAVTGTFRQALDDIWQVIAFSLAKSHALFAVCKREFPRCEDEKSCGNTIPQFLLPQLLTNFPNSCVFLQNCMLITYSKKSKFVWENLFWICIGLVFDRLKHPHCDSFWFCFILFLCFSEKLFWQFVDADFALTKTIEVYFDISPWELNHSQKDARLQICSCFYKTHYHNTLWRKISKKQKLCSLIEIKVAFLRLDLATFDIVLLTFIRFRIY